MVQLLINAPTGKVTVSEIPSSGYPGGLNGSTQPIVLERVTNYISCVSPD